MAPSTLCLLTRDFMFDAVPYSSANIFDTLAIWSLGGMMSEIMLVPFLKVKSINNNKYDAIPQIEPPGRLQAFYEALDLPGLNITVGIFAAASRCSRRHVSGDH